MEKELKPILIITYYWPPSGGAGVQRWLKFSKYLPEYGWRPIIFTPENPDFDLKDASLLKDIHPEVEVLKFPIWEPYRIFKKLSGQKELKQGQILEGSKSSWLKRLAVWLRGNLFVPDPRIFWVKPSSNYILDILETNGVKHVVTTGPPHSVHLIGLKLKMRVPSLTWIADFRDPWTEWEILHAMRISKFVWNKHRKLEQQVIKAADSLLVTSPSAGDAFKKLGARRTKVITNGYDASDVLIEAKQNQGLFRISHIGMLSEKRNPHSLWQAISEIISSNSQMNFEIKLTGIISDKVLNTLASDQYIKGALQVQDSVAHEQVGGLYAESDLLLLIQTKSEGQQTQLPGKLFEYLQAKKPILCIGDTNSDLAKIIKETNSGQCFGYDDSQGILHFLQLILSKDLDFSFTGIERFSRRELTQELSEFLTRF